MMAQVGLLAGVLLLAVAIHGQSFPFGGASRGAQGQGLLQQYLLQLLASLQPNPPASGLGLMGQSPNIGAGLDSLMGRTPNLSTGLNGLMGRSPTFGSGLNGLMGRTPNLSTGLNGLMGRSSNVGSGLNGLMGRTPNLGTGLIPRNARAGMSGGRGNLMLGVDFCERQCSQIPYPVCSATGSSHDNMCRLECASEPFLCYGECPCTAQSFLIPPPAPTPSNAMLLEAMQQQPQQPNPFAQLLQLSQSPPQQTRPQTRPPTRPPTPPQTRPATRPQQIPQFPTNPNLQPRSQIDQQIINALSLPNPISNSRQPNMPQMRPGGRPRPQPTPQSRPPAVPQPPQPTLPQYQPSLQQRGPPGNSGGLSSQRRSMQCMMMCNARGTEPVCAMGNMEIKNDCLANCMGLMIVCNAGCPC